MSSGQVVFHRTAVAHLEELRDFISERGGAERAETYTDGIIQYCQDLAVFPLRGTARDDIRPGLRTIGYKRRVVIAFTVLGETVAILGLYYGGRDYERDLAAL